MPVISNIYDQRINAWSPYTPEISGRNLAILCTVPSFDKKDKASVPSTPFSSEQIEELLDRLTEINPAAFSYICLIRSKQNAPTFINSTYGDFLIKNRILRLVEGKTNKSDSCQLSAETESWFDQHPELDPLVLNNSLPESGVNSVPPRPAAPHNERPQQPILGSALFDVAYPVRCLLIASDGVPSKIGIVRLIDQSGVQVEIPAEQRSPKIIHAKFLESTPPHWLVVADDDHSFDHVEGFRELLNLFVSKDESNEPSEQHTTTNAGDSSVSVPDESISGELSRDPLMQANFGHNSNLRSLVDGLIDGSKDFKRRRNPTHLPVLPDKLSSLDLESFATWYSRSAPPNSTFKLTFPQQLAALPQRTVFEHAFNKDLANVGDLLFMRNPDPSMWAVLIGIDPRQQSAALWLAGSDRQTNFVVAALESRWRWVKLEDFDRADGLGLDSDTMFSLVQKALEVRANPIDPFAPRPEAAIVEEIEVTAETPASEPSRNDRPIDSSSSTEATPKLRPSGRIARFSRRSPKSEMTEVNVRLAEAISWVQSRIIPMIESARSTGDWSSLGCKDWQPEEKKQFHRICSHYTGTVNNWYAALIALSKDFSSQIIGEALTPNEIEMIKLQVEEKRRAKISERKSTFDPAQAETFLTVEMPQLIARARANNDWSALEPAVLLNNYRTRRLVEQIQGRPSMREFVRLPRFGLSQRELDLIDKKKPVDPDKARNDFEHVLRDVIVPLIQRCRFDSDYRPLERARLSEHPLIRAAIEYIGGRPDAYHAFYLDKRIPLTKFERTILTAREFTPTRCEQILENRIKPLIERCRESVPPDFTPLRNLGIRRDRELIALARYLGRSRSIRSEVIIENPRVGLTEHELALIYNSYPDEQI